jgi:acetyltransferase EpsM
MNYLIGAGGHALVILDICKLAGIHVHGLFTDAPANPKILGYPVHRWGDLHVSSADEVLIAVGSNEARKRLASDLQCGFFSAVHPSAIIDASVTIGKGSVVMAGALLNAFASIGEHVIVNTGAVIDHESVIADFAHISPGVTLCGNVRVGEGTHIGAGAVVIPNIRIGKGCVIGAGTVVIRDVPDCSMVVGNPGRIIKQLNPF